MNTQPFPTSGQLARNCDLSLKLLRSILDNQDGPGYAYIVDTVRFNGTEFEQTGSAPNWQGGIVTLATCKHQMRSGMSESRWSDVWIAGFTGVEVIPAHAVNYLVYLMRVDDAYRSQRDLWLALSDEARIAKRSDQNRLGDVYSPRVDDGDPFSPEVYEAPRPDHVHCNDYDWRHDIDYVSVYGRRPPLLRGDPAYTFLWKKPLVAYPVGTHPRTKKHGLQQLLHELVHRPLHGRA